MILDYHHDSALLVYNSSNPVLEGWIMAKNKVKFENNHAFI